MRIHYFQHVFFEDLACIQTWAEQNGHRLSVTKFYENTSVLPKIDEIDWLIVMGGSMSAYEEHLFDWLKTEKNFIREAILANKIVIGICLGAQLIADVLGAKVYPNQEKEIGWFDVFQTNEGKKHELFKNFEPHFTVFHWHGDTFDLPKNAIRLLESEACKNQAFLYKNNVLGLQFHFENDQKAVEKMCENGKTDLQNKGQYIQIEKQILQNKAHFQENKQKLFAVLDFFSKQFLTT